MSDQKQAFFDLQDVVFADECVASEAARHQENILSPSSAPSTSNSPEVSATTTTSDISFPDNEIIRPFGKRKASSEIEVDIDQQKVSNILSKGFHHEGFLVPREETKELELPAKLFTGLIFYFIPNSRVNMARNLRMKKVEENGGRIADTFDAQDITHLVVDKNLNAAIVHKATQVLAFDLSVTVLNEFWTPDCVIYNRLLPVTDKYRVQGISYSDLQQDTPSVMGAQSSKEMDKLPDKPQSLQIKPRETRQDQIETSLPSTPTHSLQASLVKSTISPTITFARTQHLVHLQKSSSEVARSWTEKNDELEYMLSTVRALGDVRLEEEQQLAALELSEIEDKPYSMGLPSNLSSESRFRCMQPVKMDKSKDCGPNDFIIAKVMLAVIDRIAVLSVVATDHARVL